MKRSKSTSDPLGIDRGDAQAITDRRVGRRAASLAENAAFAGKADQILDGQKIGLVAQFVDQRQLVLEQRAHFGGQAVRITPARLPRSIPPDIAAATGPAGHISSGYS